MKEERYNPFEHGFHVKCSGCKHYHPENYGDENEPPCKKGYTGIDSYYARDLNNNIICGCWNWEKMEEDT